MVVDRHWRYGSYRIAGNYRDAQRSLVGGGVAVVVRNRVAGGHFAREVGRGHVVVATIGVHRQRTGGDQVTVQVRAEYRRRRANRDGIVYHSVAVGVYHDRSDHLPVTFSVAVVRQQVTAGRRIDGRLIHVVLRHRKVGRSDRCQVQRSHIHCRITVIIGNAVGHDFRSHESGSGRVLKRTVVVQQQGATTRQREGRTDRDRVPIAVRGGSHRLFVSFRIIVVPQYVTGLWRARGSGGGIVGSKGGVGGRVGTYRNAKYRIVREAILIENRVINQHLTDEFHRRSVVVSTILTERDRTGVHRITGDVDTEDGRRRTNGQYVIEFSVTVRIDEGGSHHDHLTFGVKIVRRDDVATDRRILLGRIDVVNRYGRLRYDGVVSGFNGDRQLSYVGSHHWVIVRDRVLTRHLTDEAGSWRVGVGTITVHRDRAGGDDVAVRVRSEDRRIGSDGHHVVHDAVTVGVGQEVGHRLVVSLGVAVVGQQVTADGRFEGGLVDVVVRHREVRGDDADRDQDGVLDIQVVTQYDTEGVTSHEAGIGGVVNTARRQVEGGGHAVHGVPTAVDPDDRSGNYVRIDTDRNHRIHQRNDRDRVGRRNYRDQYRGRVLNAGLAADGDTEGIQTYETTRRGVIDTARGGIEGSQTTIARIVTYHCTRDRAPYHCRVNTDRDGGVLRRDDRDRIGGRHDHNGNDRRVLEALIIADDHADRVEADEERIGHEVNAGRRSVVSRGTVFGEAAEGCRRYVTR